MTDLSLREQIASTICGDRAVDNWNATDADYELADAILELLKGAVKPLEWECEAGWRWKGTPPNGFFASVAKWVWDSRAGHFKVGGLNEQYATLDEAKAAAQADYSTRILAALGVK